MRHGQRFHVENLLWSGTKILNNCEDSLRQKIEEMSLGYPVESLTGPVYFKIMIDLVISSSAGSLRALSKILETLSLKNFDGENVVKACSFIRGAV